MKGITPIKCYHILGFVLGPQASTRWTTDIRRDVRLEETIDKTAYLISTEVAETVIVIQT